MVRSLVAVVIAVIVGLAAAKAIESIGITLFPFPEGVSAMSTDSMTYHWPDLPLGYKLFLAAGWSLGAFAASSIALFIGRRWAPLGLLAAAAIALQGATTLLYFPAESWLWLITAVGVVTASFVPGILLKAKRQYPAQEKTGVFGD